MLLYANGAVLLANLIFAVGNVVSKIGLTGTNPLMFALIREVVSGPLLCLLALYFEPGVRIKRQHYWRFMLTGFSLFGTNFFYIVGVKLAGATTASLWQPAQPLFITGMAIYVGYERSTLLKFIGILVASAGCLFTSLWGGSSGIGGSGTELAGNVMFFLQGICCATFYVSEKPLLQRYPPITTVGFAYIIASCLMTVAAVVVNETPLLDRVCSDCDGNGWAVPVDAWVAIAYWVFAGSILGYLLNTWGNKYVDASLLGIYTVVQPVVTVLCSSAVIAVSASPHWGLKGVGLADLGAVAVVAGLALVVYENAKNPQQTVTHLVEDTPSKVRTDQAVDAAGIASARDAQRVLLLDTESRADGRESRADGRGGIGSIGGPVAAV